MVQTLVAVMVVAGVLAVVVWLPRLDGAARERVSVDAADFAVGTLPQISAKTGQPADVGVAIGRSSLPLIPVAVLREPKGIIPLTTSQHERFTAWKQINRVASPIVPVALFASIVVRGLGGDAPSTWSKGLVDALALIAVEAFIVAIVTNLGAQRLLADPRAGDTPGTVALRGVHPEFARAAQSPRATQA